MPFATSKINEQVQAIDEHGTQVQAMFSKIAPGYDRANRLMSLGTDIRWRNRGVQELLRDHPHKILDLCAGTLDSTKAIAHKAADAQIMASDFSAGMIEAGLATLSSEQRRRISTQIADAHQLPFESSSFDAIFCAFGVRNLSNLHRASQEKARCLRPGGRLVVIDFFRPHQWWTKSFHKIYNHTVLPAVGWACTGHLDAYRYLPRSIGRFVSPVQYAQILESSGFQAVQTIPLTGGIATLVCAQAQPNPSQGGDA